MVVSGLPRTHWPVVAVSVPDRLVVHPVAASKLSEYTVVPPPPPTARAHSANAAASPERLRTVSETLLGNVSHERW